MPFLRVGCVLLASCLAVCSGQEPDDLLDLAAGHPVSVLLTPEHGATLRLDLKGSEAAQIFLDAAIPDISYCIAANDGTEILSGRLATFGWAAIPMSAAGQREVQIQLKTESGVEGLPGVRVRAELRSISPKTLEAYKRAANLFNAAQTLHRSLRAEDVRQSIWQFARSAEEWARGGDLYGESLALGGEGESEIELSRYADAKWTLERALLLTGNNAYLRGWLLHLAARVLIDQWLGTQVKSYAEEEMQLGQEIGDAA